MSHSYEHTIANDIHDATRSDVRAYPCGYSGSNAMPQPDVLVTSPSENYAMELKGPIAKDTVDIEKSDLQQLVDCTNSYTSAFLVIKFQRRRPVVVRYFPQVSGDDEYNDLGLAEQFARLVPEEFNPRVRTSDETGTTRLYIDKPSTDEWESGYGEDDARTIMSRIGLVAADEDTIDLSTHL